MGKTIYLKLDTELGILTIPFIGIIEVDDFTIRYENAFELIATLIKVLELNLDVYDVNEVYLTYNQYSREFNDKDCMYVKYRSDNYNIDSLMGVYFEYLRDDLRRIYESDIKFSNTLMVLKYSNGEVVNDFDIKVAIRKYFGSDASKYKRMRDIYFDLRYINRYHKNIRIDRVPVDKIAHDNDLSKYNLEDDSYLSNVIELYKKGTYTFDEAMERIGLIDLQELNKLLKKDGYGIVDGVSDKKLLNDDIRKIEECTGISLEKLRLNHTSFGRKKGSRR